MLKATAGELPGLLTLEPVVHRDNRGFFVESYSERDFTAATGIDARFVQENHSRSRRNVLRGLHYQVARPQAKLVRVLSGRIYDVVLDVRKASPTLGRWQGRVLDSRDASMLWIPEGYAHGFLVLSESSDVLYKTTDYWFPDHERAIAWDDPDLTIPWPARERPILSLKDERGSRLRDADLIT